MLLQESGFPLFDGWYHFEKARQVFSSSFFNQNFPELRHTTLNTSYAGLHWGYHVLGAPFALLGTTGFQIFHILVVASTGILIHFLVRQHGGENVALMVTLLVCVTPIFVLRICLPRAICTGLFFVLLGCHFLTRRKHTIVSIILFVLVWTYTAWVFLLSAAVIWWGLDALHRPTDGDHPTVIWYVVIAASLAMLCNPFFPSNFQVTWQQTILFNFIDIPVGNEWSAMNPVGYGWLIPIFVFTAVGWNKNRSLMTETVFWGILTAGFLIVTLISTVRGITYVVPCLAIFTASFFRELSLPSHQKTWLRQLWAGVGFVAALSTLSMARSVGTKTPLEKLEPCIEKARTSFDENTFLFNPLWDDFPRLYASTSFRYSTGLDPRFTYFKRRKLYESVSELQNHPSPRQKLQAWNASGVIARQSKKTNELMLSLLDSGAEPLERNSGCYLLRL